MRLHVAKLTSAQPCIADVKDGGLLHDNGRAIPVTRPKYAR
jgi:hypothetical protein